MSLLRYNFILQYVIVEYLRTFHFHTATCKFQNIVIIKYEYRSEASLHLWDVDPCT